VERCHPTGLGELKLSKPIAWQEKDGKKLPVEVSYKLIGKNRYSFVVAKADPSLPIVIDPVLQATYLGGSGKDDAYALAISGSNVYVVGYTNSNDFFGATSRASDRIDQDAFVAKLNSSLNLLQATYLGGSGTDSARALAISGSDVYVVGYTNSNDFFGATLRASNRTDYDAFVAKLNSSLNLLQITYLGGSGTDSAYALAISGSDVYVVGETLSNDFPGAINPRTRTDSDAFVAKLNSSLNLTSLQSIYLGGSGNDIARALAISGSDVYVVGWTNSNDFFGASSRASSRTDSDAFVVELDSSLNLLRITYLGGSGNDSAYALAISGSDVYVVGETLSNDFPGAINPRTRTDSDAFVAKLSADLTGSDGGSDSGGGTGGGGGSGGGSGGGGGGSGGGSSGGGGGSGGGSSGGGGGTGGGGGGGCSMTGSSSASLWNIPVWLSIPFFALARRIRRR
jgi:FOG: PKD repeat